MVVVNKEQEQILKKYNIELSDYNTIAQLLIDIDDEMTNYLNESDEPLPEFYELQKVYDELYKESSVK